MVLCFDCFRPGQSGFHLRARGQFARGSCAHAGAFSLHRQGCRFGESKPCCVRGFFLSSPCIPTTASEDDWATASALLVYLVLDTVEPHRVVHAGKVATKPLGMFLTCHFYAVCIGLFTVFLIFVVSSIYIYMCPFVDMRSTMDIPSQNMKLSYSGLGTVVLLYAYFFSYFYYCSFDCSQFCFVAFSLFFCTCSLFHLFIYFPIFSFFCTCSDFLFAFLFIRGSPFFLFFFCPAVHLLHRWCRGGRWWTRRSVTWNSPSSPTLTRRACS